MSQIGDLTVKIGADTSGLTKGVDDAKQKVDGLGKSADGASFNFKAFSVAALAAAAATAVVVKRAIDAADAFNDLAERTGISVSALSRLEYAARFADVSLGELQGGIVMLTRNMNMASQGTGEAGDAFRLLGVNFKNADGSLRASDEVLMDLADRFSEMQDGANKTALAIEIFGRSGAQIIPLLNQGRDGIKRYGDELQRFGGVITPEAAAQAGIFNDNLDRLKAAAAGAANQMTQSLLPSLNEMLAYLVALNEVRIEKGFWSTIFGMTELGAILDGGEIQKRITEVFKGIKEEQKKQLAEINKPDQRAPAPTQTGLTEKEKDALADKIQAIQDSYKTERELLDQKLADDQKQLSKALESRLITEEEYNRTIEGLKAAHIARLNEIEANSPEAKRAELVAQNVEQIRQGLLSEEEALLEQHERKLEMLTEYYGAELELNIEHNTMLAQLEQELQDKLTEIRKRGMSDMEKFTAMSYKQQAQTIFKELTNISNGVASNNKTLFNLNKAAGIANAIVNAYEGISLTMAKYPYPINIGMAAAHGAAAFAQVSAIASQSYSGGQSAGGGAAPALAGSTAATPVSPVAGAAMGGGQMVSINLQGEVFGREQVRSLIGQINEAISDGAVLRVQ